MKPVVALASALFVTLVASNAGAVTKWKYTYVGNSMPGFQLGDGGDLTDPVDPLPGYGLELVIDETELPGGTLRSASVLFCHGSFACPEGELVFTPVPPPGAGSFATQVFDDGLASFRSFGNPEFEWEPDEEAFNEDARIELQTDAVRQVAGYRLVFSGNSTPAGRVELSGDNYFLEECRLTPGVSTVCEWENSAPGTWTVAPIPVPAGLPLSLAGIGALGLAGWRRRRKAA